MYYHQKNSVTRFGGERPQYAVTQESRIYLNLPTTSLAWNKNIDNSQGFDEYCLKYHKQLPIFQSCAGYKNLSSRFSMIE